MLETQHNEANLECIVKGTDLAFLLFKRLAKRMEGIETMEDIQINDELDTWLETSLEADAQGAVIPLIQIYKDECLTPTELFILLILFILECEHGLPRQCAALQGNDELKHPTRDFLFDLIYPHGAQKFLFYAQFENIRILDNPRLVRKIYSSNNVVEYALATGVVQRLLEQEPDLSTPYSSFVDFIIPQLSWNDFVFDGEKKDALLKLFRGFFLCLEKNPKASLIVFLSGKFGTGKRSFCEAVANKLKVPLYRVNTSGLLASKNCFSVIHEIFSDSQTRQGILCFPDIQDLLTDGSCIRAIHHALSSYNGLVIFTVPAMQNIPEAIRAQTNHIVEFDTPTRSKRAELWKLYLKRVSKTIAKQISIDNLASNYILTGSQIAQAVSIAQYLTQNEETLTDEHLDEACRLMMYQSFDGLTSLSHVEKSALTHLILPKKQKAEFEQILAAARNHEHVMVDWGFGSHLSTGKGLCVLFDGPPGTGKTFAAEVIASELHRPLQRVDMSNLVSKWVGETGNNLARLFAAARAGRAILLLDEADALLSKRVAQTSKSTDRYANMEVNILLQEIERYNGITILTTNHEQSLDEALQRRIQFRISFENPEREERIQLWKKLIAPQAEIEKGIDFNRLGTEFELSGGYIKNAILTAAFKASSEQRKISENDLFVAATDECRKMGKLCRERENIW